MAKAKAMGGERRAAETRAPASVEAATVVELCDERDRLRVRAAADGERTRALEARVALIAGYRPSVGDRVLVARGGSEWFVVGVLAAATPPSLQTADGTTATVIGEALELRDGAGRLLVRHEAGLTTVSAPERDLKLSAPHGRVVIEAGTDVDLRAARDVRHAAGRRLDLAAGVDEASPQVRLDPSSVRVASPQVELTSRSARLTTGEASVVARAIQTTAIELTQNVERYELTAQRLVEKSRDCFRDVKDLFQQRIGRARTIVRDVYSLNTRRTTMVSRDETTVDGKKILLG